MKLLFMRHSDRDKASGLRDPDQPLTPEGIRKAEAIAQGIRDRLASGETVTGIVSSPAKHSLDTAKAVSQILGMGGQIRSSPVIASDAPVEPLLELLRQRAPDEVVLVVGHQPQLGAVVEALTAEQIPIRQGGVCCVLAGPNLRRATLAWRLNPRLNLMEEPMKYDMKFFTGVFFFLMDLLAFVVGVWLMSSGLGLLGGGSGEGNISIIVDQVGQITGVNGRLVVFIAGFALVLASVGYARKAYQEARALEHGLKDTVRHFSPL